MANNKKIYAASGMSKKPDAFEAGVEVVTNTLKDLSELPTLMLVFCSGGKYGSNEKSINQFVKGVDKTLKQKAPKCRWVGCTTAREVSNHGFNKDSAVALALSTDNIHFGLGVSKNVIKNPYKAGQKAAKDALHDLKMDRYVHPYTQFIALKKKGVHDLVRMNPYFLMTFMPGSTKKYLPEEDNVFKGIMDVAGSLPLIGASAADDYAFDHTYVFADGKAYKDAIIVISMVSNLKANIGVKHGYSPTSKVAIVTKSDDKIVYELNGRPAVDVYAEFVGATPDDLRKNIMPTITNYPFGVPDSEGNYWIKSPMAVVNDTALSFFAPVQEKRAIVLMEATKKSVVESAKEAIHESVHSSPKDLEALFYVSCAARVLYLGDQIEKEFEIVKETLKNKPFIGIHGYAEHTKIPAGSIGHHGWTFVCLGITNKMIAE